MYYYVYQFPLFRRTLKHKVLKGIDKNRTAAHGHTKTTNQREDKMKTLTTVVACSLLLISSSAWAFMPAPGIWNFTAESTGVNAGKPGRGFMVEVQNEVLFLSYFGYRADGSSVKYYAAGPIVNNTFTSDMLDIVGGTAIGGPYKPAVVNGSIGTVSLNFTSGTHGWITLPGDIPREIYKVEFGYAAGPDGLLGTWLLSTLTTTGPLSEAKTLTTKLGTSTSTGNGVVTTTSYDFFCEYQVSGTFTGMVVCGDLPLQQYSNAYIFKFSGDVGTGVGDWYEDPSATTLSPFNESHELRIATKTGAETGLNDGTFTSLSILSAMRKSATSTLPITDAMSAKALAASKQANGPLSEEDAARASAVSAWAAEVSTIMQHNP